MKTKNPITNMSLLKWHAAETGVTRDQLVAVLHAENVLARKYFYPGIHRMEPYCSLFPDAGLHLSETEAIAERVLVLPTGLAVTSADIVKICAIIRSAIEHNPRSTGSPNQGVV